MAPDDRARIVSLNVGAPRDVTWRGEIVTTAIWKTPIDGRVALRGVNFVGDDQADRRVHGGPDKAVYAYAQEDYEWWRDETELDTAPALFGENLTTQGIDLSAARVGERWRVGTTELEVAQPRLPCYKLGIRVGDPRFVRTFLQAKRPGAYLRIVREGDVGAGDTIEVLSRPDHEVTMRFMVDAVQDRAKRAVVRITPGVPHSWTSE